MTLDGNDDVQSKMDGDESRYSEDDALPPAITHATSSESSSTESSGVVDPKVPVLKRDARELVQTIISEEDANIKSLDEDARTAPTGRQYLSKDIIETLLACEFLEDSIDGMERDEVRTHDAAMTRKELIQRELDSLVEAARRDLENDGEELEPEAIEAIGIAANRVAYLKKYYDVAACEYVYVPSVAHTILDGSLLQEACMHYFGAKEEFLVAYAGSLGMTILRTQQAQAMGLCGQQTLHDVVSAVADSLPSVEPWIYDEATSDWCWGVSPLAATTVVAPFRTPVTTTHDARWRTVFTFNKKFVWVAVMGLVLGARLWIATNGAQSPLLHRTTTTQKAFELYSEANPTCNAIMSSSQEDANDTAHSTIKGTPRNGNDSRRTAPMVPNLLYNY